MAHGLGADRVRPVLALLLLAALLGGCGKGAEHLQVQKAVFDYQVQLGAINTAFAGAPATGQAGERALTTALARYRRLQPPPLLRSLHRRMVRALEDRLSATRRAGRAVAAGDTVALRRSIAVGTRAQARLGAELRRVALVVQQCRRSRPAC